MESIKKKVVTDVILNKSSYKDPIPVSEYLDVLKPEYTVTQHWEEAFYSENNSYEGHWVLNITHDRLETDEEFQKRVKHNHDLAVATLRNKVKQGNIGDFYFLKNYNKEGKITECTMLRLQEVNQEDYSATFQMHNAKSSAIYILKLEDFVNTKNLRLIGPLK